MSQQDIRGQWETVTSRLAFSSECRLVVAALVAIGAYGIGIAGTIALLLLRMLHIDHAPWSFAALGTGLLVSMLVAWLLARRGFDAEDQARVRLEDALGLKTRLERRSTRRGHVADVARGEHPNAADLALAAASGHDRAGGFAVGPCLVGASALSGAEKTQLIEKPSAVQQVVGLGGSTAREGCHSAQVAAGRGGEKTEDLLKRPGDQWYERAASLEAADNLRDQTGKSLQELGTQLEQTRGNRRRLWAELGGAFPQRRRTGIAKQLSQNLQGLRSGAMKADADLLQQLQSMDPKALSGMSKVADVQKLQQRLKQNAEALRKALAQCPRV